MNELTVNDGFKFGCGFFLAGFVAYVVLVVVTILIVMLAGGTLANLVNGLLTIVPALPLL